MAANTELLERTALIVFAKAPVPGQAKTRLIPALGAEGAAALHAALVERALDTALAVADAQGWWMTLCCTPDARHPFFADCAEDFEIDLTEQINHPDLGQRMLAALKAALAEEERALLIGSDCPALTKKQLLTAAEALLTHDVVLIPAEDGGYVLIGARKTHAAMFANIRWGEGSVFATQLEALKACGLSCATLEPLWDVDLPADLPRLSTLKPPLAFSLDTQGPE
jgi:uncharacterized protein